MKETDQTLLDIIVRGFPQGEQAMADRALRAAFPNPNSPSLWLFAKMFDQNREAVEALREAADVQLEAAVAAKLVPAQIESKLKETIAGSVKSEIAREFAKQTKDQRSILSAIYDKRTWHKFLLSRILSWAVIPLLLFAGFSFFVFLAPSMWAVSTLLEVPGSYVSLENDKAWVSLPKDSVRVVLDDARPDRTFLEIRLPPRDLLEARNLLEGRNDEKAKPSQ